MEKRKLSALPRPEATAEMVEMADNQRHRIKNLLQKLNDEDRNSLCCLLVKAGYAVRIGKERPGGKGQTMYFVEYWVEGDDTNAETGN